MILEKLLLFLSLITAVKLARVGPEDALVAYLGNGEENSEEQNGDDVLDNQDEKFTGMLESLLKNLGIPRILNQSNQHNKRKNLGNEEPKGDLRMCTYDHPCKAKKKKEESCEQKEDSCEVQKKKEKKKEECKPKEDSCEKPKKKKKDVCEDKKKDQCVEKKQEDECIPEEEDEC